MKKIKKIVAFALATVMMMAMSVTAFAAEKTTITVNNLSAEEATTVAIYKIATINQDEWDWADWVTTDMYSLADGATEYTFDYAAMKAAVEKVEADETKTTSTSADDSFATTLTFDNVEAGAYLVLATGDKTAYQTMVAKTYTYNDDSVFKAKSATVVAKTSSTIVTKTADDYFVSADELVTFTINSTVPYIADDATNTEFVIYDQPTGLKNLTLESVTIGGTEVDATISEADENGVYSIDLTSYLTKDNIGKKVVITITANVDGANGYTNTAWSNRMDSEDDYSTVTGYTGSFTLTKVDANDTAKTLAGAKFSVAATKDGDALNFVYVSDGVYTLADSNVSTTATLVTELEVASDGTLKVQGLAEGTYYITETQAPEGYSINANINSVTIPESTEGNVDLTGEAYYVKDSKLASLPFTGGMGTTIFTVLGVAIMAIAAALYFATKKKNAK